MLFMSPLKFKLVNKFVLMANIINNIFAKFKNAKNTPKRPYMIYLLVPQSSALVKLLWKSAYVCQIFGTK